MTLRNEVELEGTYPLGGQPPTPREEPPGSLAEVLHALALAEPLRPLYTWLDESGEEAETLTRGDLDRRARVLAVRLAEVGVGERALLLFPPGLDFIVAFLACLYSGVVAVPAYPPRGRRSLPRLAAIVADATPRVILTTEALLSRVRNWVDETPELSGTGLWKVGGEAVEASIPEGVLPRPTGGDLAFLQYTSGSTGTPKGVRVTHGNLLHNEEMIRRAFAMEQGSVIVSWLPLYHDMGLIGGVLQPLFLGARCILTSPTAFLRRPRLWLEALHRYRGTTSGGPNFGFELVARKVAPEEVEDLDLSSWTVAFNGSEPVRPETLDRFTALLAPCGFRREAFYPCYGLAEGTLFVTGGDASAEPVARDYSAAGLEAHRAEPARGVGSRALAGCGGPWMGQRLEIVDPDAHRPLEAGRVGEIWVSGPSVADGYWNRPEETAKAFRAELAGEAGGDPFLRTGDLGFVDGAGELFVTGRLKDLIILRGRNVYPQDVERSVEAAHAALRPGCSAAFSVDVEGEERLVVACEVDRHFPEDDRQAVEGLVETIRSAVFADHEAAVYEVVLLRVGRLPKTTSGKVRRNACRRGYLDDDLGGRLEPAAAKPEPPSRKTAPIAPTPAAPSAASLDALPPTERIAALREILAARVAEVLRRPAADLPVDAPLTALGLESLAAAELQGRVEEELGLTLDYADLLDGATLGDLAERAAGAGAAAEPFRPGAADPSAEGSPLSHGQQALWFLQRMHPSSAAWHIAAAAEVDGELDPAAMERALAALARRHPSLRTTFRGRDGTPEQRVGEEPRVELLLEEMERGPDGGLDRDALRRRLAEAAYRPFDLAAGPLLRLVLLRLGEDRHALVLAVHHLVADFASLVVLVEELSALYAAEGPGEEAAALPEPAATYADFVEWEGRLLAGPEGTRLEAWWRDALDDGAVPDLDLPTDRPRPPVLSDRGAIASAPLGRELSAAVAALARERGVTRFAVLLAAFQAVLGRYSGQEDFLLGTPVAARPHPSLAGVVGYLVNPVVLRTRLGSDQAGGGAPFADLVDRAARTSAAAFDHRAFPFPRLTEALRPVRDPSRSPLFQVFFSFQVPPRQGDLGPFALGVDGAEGRLGPLRLTSLGLPEPPAWFDLNLLLADGEEGLLASLHHHRDLFDRTTAERLLGHLRILLEGAVAEPEQAWRDLPLLTPAECRQLLEKWNATAAPIPEPPLVHALFQARAERHPERPAVVEEDGTVLTYGELELRANRLAHHLREFGVGPEVPVGVFLERSAAMVEVLLGVLGAGGTYLPLDPAHPPERLAYILEDSVAPVVVTRSSLEGSLAGYDGRRVLLDRLPPAGEGDEARPAHRVDADGAAYLIYTSGSTGRPKGVVVPHRAMVSFLASMARRPGLAQDDVLVSVTTLSFDIAGLELFGPLAVGAPVVVAKRQTAASGPALLALLREHRATVLQATPTTWRLLLDADWDGDPPLRALCGGEPLARDLANAVASRAGSLWNMYGPTETTVWSAVERLEVEEGPVAIGTPIANTRIFLLDRRFRPVPVGVPGELCIGGVGLARGYFRRPGLTADRFVPDPEAAHGDEAGGRVYRTGDLARRRPDGRLDFLGRLDHQVKVRGVRIELGEIEAELVRHPSVAQAVAATREVAPGDVRLVAWVVPEPDAEAPGHPELREFLARRLPDAYLPSRFVFVDRLPLTPNGKVDRKNLPEPEDLRPDLGDRYAAPASDLERTLAGLWAELLGVDRVGVEDNFFDLGGHSLLVSRLHARLVAQGHDLEMVELFRHPTVASLAARLASGRREAGSAVAVHRPATAGRVSGDVAVVGLAGRFPGAGSASELWRRLAAGEECITVFGDDELREAGVDDALLADPAYVRAGGVLDRPARFDAAFFGYSPREAQLMDPQHRVFLECAWQALEDAGHDPRRVPGRAGVFASAGLNTYLLASGLRPGASMAGGYQAFVGNDKDFVPTRVAYQLDLKGPAVNVQTACSSSLVAVHLACRSLLSGESDVALAGGVTIRVPFREGYLYEAGGIPSPDGHCRAFDARAAGTVLGSGAGVVVLKRLEDALADGDPVRAVIKGSAINNDGAAKIGYTAPSVDGQAAVVADALGAAGVDPATVSYVEAHGTGTALGDPIEVAALMEAFRAAGGEASRHRTGWCALGSVKTNVGHLDTAAGVAGLIKAVLALEHRYLPPSLHFESPNPEIDFASSPFFVNAEGRPWESAGEPRRAGVSSFGIGGTNVHLVLEEAPSRPRPEAGTPARPWQVLPLSARTESALEAATADLGRALAEAEEGGADGPVLEDVAWTLQAGRHPLARRRVLVAANRADAAGALAAGDRSRFLDRVVEDGADRPSVAFLLPGQGSQHPGAGRGLYATEPVFRRELDRVCELAAPHLGFDLRELLVASDPEDGEAAARLTRTEVAQPALFAVEHALARLWMDWGVVPTALLGHSLGEYVAATLAGVFTLEDGVALVAARGCLMGELPDGDMLGVEGDPDSFDPQRLAERLPAELALAAVNAPGSAVVSGPAEVLAAFARELEGEGLRNRVLHTSHAFHSSMMDPILERFTAEVAKRPRRAPEVPVVSNRTGRWLTAAEATDPAYWAGHLRHTVRFADGVGTLLEEPGRILLEVGPGRALSQLAGRVARRREKGAGGAPAPVLASLPHPRDPQPEEAALAEAVGRLWLAGAAVDWAAYAGDRPRRRVSLPPYPFEGEDHVLPGVLRAASSGQEEAAGVAVEGAAEVPVDPADRFHVPRWRQSVPIGAPGSAAVAQAGPWLLLLDREGVLEGVAERLRSLGAVVDTVVADPLAAGYVAVGEGVHGLDPGRREDFAALAAALAGAGRLPRRVVHGWNLGRGLDLPAADRVAPFHSFVSLAVALEEAGAFAGDGRVELTAVTSGAARVGGETLRHPERALVLGPVRALPQDCPGLDCRAVDLDAADLAAPDSGGETDGPARDVLAADLLAELVAEDRERAERVAWRGGERWVEEHRSFRLAAPEGRINAPAGAAWWITGGLGGVGFALARELASGGARLLLTGRSDLETADGAGDGDPRRQRLEELEAAGAEVLYLAADVTDGAAMAAALARGEERFGPLHGVIHAAGVAGGGLAQRRTAAEVDRVLAPKVEGTRILGDLLAPRLAAGELGVLLLCSSINGVVGGFGQTDYCAANAFLDAYAETLPRRRGSRAVAVAWDRWQGIGMAADGTGGLLSALASGSGGGTAVHPLLGSSLGEVAGRRLWLGELAPARHWVLSEHRVLGTPTLPGTTYLEMVRAAFVDSGLAGTGGGNGAEDGGGAAPGAVTLTDVAFLAPLAVADGRSRRTLTVLDPDADGAAFRVLSRDGGGDWVEHVRGRVAAAPRDAGPRRHDPAALVAACDGRFLTAADVAAEGGGEESFLVTGPRWQALKSLAVGEGRAVARFELDPRFAADLDTLPLHPALLDAAAGAVRFLAEGDYLPLAYQELTVLGPLPRTGYGVLALGGGLGEDTAAGAGSGTLTCDVTVLDEEGRERVRVRGFTMRRVHREAAARLAAAEAAPASAPEAPGDAPAGPSAGLSEADALDAFRRILSAPPVPRLVVSSRPVDRVRREVRRFDRDRVGRELAALAAGPRAPEGGGSLPEGDLEPRIAAVWQRVLGVERVGVHDNFFELGGTSLSGIQLISELKRELGVDVPTVTIFEAPTVAALARHLAPPEDAETTTERAQTRAEKKRRALSGRRPVRPPRPGRGSGRVDARGPAPEGSTP